MDLRNALEETFSSINILDFKVNDNFEFHKQCEICYKTQDCNILDILKTDFKSKSLIQMLEHFPSIKNYRLIEYSFNLCLICVKQLICSYLFLEKLKQSNKKFKGLLKLDNKKELSEPSQKKEFSVLKSNIRSEEQSKQINDSLNVDINVGEDKDDQKPLPTKNKGIMHDHSYVQSNINEVHDTNEDIEIKDEMENIRILVEKDSDLPEKCRCHLCGAGFSRNQSLNFHIRRIHLNEKTFLCSTCGKQFFLKVDYDRHILLHKEDPSHTCNLCKKGFVTASLLKSHINTVHKDKELKCDHCPKMFKLQVQLRRHIMSIHSSNPTEQRSLKTKDKLACKICGKKINKYGLKTHMQRHSGPEKYRCAVCGQAFFQHISLNNHMIRHQDPKFSCEYCGKSHFTKQEMLTHIRRHHTREIVCSCQHCGKGFVHKSNLIQHIRNCHPSENESKIVEQKVPKQCTVCGKIYSSRTSLIHHRRRAHENKQYSCTECKMTFRNLVPLKSHLKKIHNIGDTYICEICNKSFYTYEDLYKHKKRTHQIGANSMYLCCTVCQTKFKTKHELIQHIHCEHLNDAIPATTPILYECLCVTFFLDFEIFKKHLADQHCSNSKNQVIISEYEIGGCKVQSFYKRKGGDDRDEQDLQENSGNSVT